MLGNPTIGRNVCRALKEYSGQKRQRWVHWTQRTAPKGARKKTALLFFLEVAPQSQPAIGRPRAERGRTGGTSNASFKD